MANIFQHCWLVSCTPDESIRIAQDISNPGDREADWNPMSIAVGGDVEGKNTKEGVRLIFDTKWYMEELADPDSETEKYRHVVREFAARYPGTIILAWKGDEKINPNQPPGHKRGYYWSAKGEHDENGSPLDQSWISIKGLTPEDGSMPEIEYTGRDGPKMKAACIPVPLNMRYELRWRVGPDGSNRSQDIAHIGDTPYRVLRDWEGDPGALFPMEETTR